MDPTFVQGMREAKALLDEGVLSQGEYESEKARLFKQREDREAASHRVGTLKHAKCARQPAIVWVHFASGWKSQRCKA